MSIGKAGRRWRCRGDKVGKGGDGDGEGEGEGVGDGEGEGDEDGEGDGDYEGDEKRRRCLKEDGDIEIYNENLN